MKMRYKNTAIFFILFLLAFAVNSKDEEFLQCEYNPTFVNMNNFNSKWRRNDSLYISPYVYYQKRKQAKYVLLADMRSSDDFKQFNIKGSFSFPQGSLFTKTMFKNHAVILVGNGRDYKKLERMVEKLNIKGFEKVQILDGGTNFWKTMIVGKKLKLNDYEVPSLNNILSEDRSNWLIVDTSNNDKISDLFPNVVRMSAIDKNMRLETINKNNGLLKNVLLVSSELSSDENLINQLQSKIKTNIYTIDTVNLNLAITQYYNKQRQVSYKKRTDGAKLSCL